MTIERTAVADACAYFEQFLEFRQRFERVPGIQAAVLHDDEIVLSCAHGLADAEAGTPLTTDHRFRIASHSKTFTATAIVRLAEQGRLRLDDTADNWVAELGATGLGAVTLRELLAHGGGVVRDGWDGDHWQLARPFPDAARLIEIACDDAAVLGRNERFKYSNVGFALLGAVIEAATGQGYADHVTGALLAPLGLDATSADIDPAATGDHATGYTALSYADRRLPFDHIQTGAMAAATGFSSTATDLVRWAAAHFHGDDRVVSDDAKRMMQRTEWRVGGAAGEYGLGLAVAGVGGRRVLGHGGGFPGFTTRTWFDPVDRLAVAVLTNAVDGPALTLADAGVRLVDVAASACPDDPVADAARYTGRFATQFGVYDIVALGGRLHLLDPTVADPLAEPQRLEVVDAHTLRVADAPGYASLGERVAYERDADGGVLAVRGGSGTTALPLDRFAAWLGERDRIHLGARLRS